MYSEKLSLEKSIIIIAIFCISGLLIMGYYKISRRDYIAVEATIVGVRRMPRRVSEDEDRLACAYEYNLNGQTYIAMKPLYFISSVREGKSETIRVNPDNPEELEDELLYKVVGGGELLFIIFLIRNVKKLIHQRKKRRKIS